jgi:uncharacterized membrane protein
LGEEQLWWVIGLPECLLGFMAILGICCLAYYCLANTSSRSRSRKINNGIRSEAVIQDFARLYQKGKITQAQFEDIVRRYSSK